MYGHRREQWSVVVAEAKLNNIVYLCAQCTPVKLFVLNCWSIHCARLASVEVLLTILKVGDRMWRILCPFVEDLVPFCGGSCVRCSLMQGGTGQGKPHRSEYRVRPGLKIYG